MNFRELCERSTTLFGELEAHHPRVVRVRDSSAETRGSGAIDELHDAVRLQQQVIRRLADCRTGGMFVALDREEQLMLCGGQPGVSSQLFALAEEAAKFCSKEKEVPVLLMPEISHWTGRSAFAVGRRRAQRRPWPGSGRLVPNNSIMLVYIPA